MGGRSIYLTPKAPCANINPNSLKVLTSTADGLPHQSSALCNLLHTNLRVTSGHIIPQFHHKLMGIGPLCDHICRVLFEKKPVTVYSRDNNVLLRRLRELKGAKLWRFTICLKGHTTLPGDYSTGLTALTAHNLPSVASMVRYLHV